MNGEQARKDNVTLSSKTTLTANKLSAAPDAEPNAEVEVPESMTINALNQNMKKGNDNFVASYDDADTILELGSGLNKSNMNKTMAYKAIELVGLVGSVLWVFYSAVYFMRSGGSFDPTVIGGMLTGIFAPVAVFWLCFSHVMRKKDVEFYAENLRSELEGLLFPSKKHATKVNKDIQLLCQQVADMNNNSRAALKSIQRARHGLRNEIRDFSSVASKAEFHIDRLGDVLEARKSGLMESIGEIEMHENVLKDHAKNGLDAWRSAEADILTISQDVEAKLYSGVERINGAAEQAHEKVQSIDETMQSTYQSMQSAVDNFGVRLDGLSSDFDGHVEALSNSADRVSDETEKLGGHIRGEVDSLEKMTIQAIEAMAESSMSIEAQRRELSNGVDRLSEEAKDLAARIEDAAGNMDETVAVAVARSIEIEERMGKQADRIGDVSHMLDEKASNLEKSGDHIASQLGDAMSVAISGSEKLRSAVRRISEEMDKTSQQTGEAADELLEKISVKFENLHDHSAHNIAKIRHAANDFDDVIIRLDKSVERNGAMISGNVVMLDDKRSDIERTCKDFTLQISELVESFDNPISEITEAGQELELRQEKVSKILENRTADLSDAGDRAQGQAEKIRDILGAQVQDLSALSGELSGHSAGLEDRVRRQREQLNEYLGAMMEKVDAHGESVDGHLLKLKSTNEDITFSIDRFEEDMDEFNASIHSKAAESKKTLGDMEETYFEHWSRVESHSTKSAKRLESAIDVLKHSSQETLPVYDEVLEKVDRAESRFKELNLGFVDLSDDSLERMKKLRERLEETAMNMDASVTESGKNLRLHEDGLREAALLIDESSQSATSKLKGVESRLNDQENNIRLIADKMEIRIDGLNDTIGQQFIGLTESVGQAVAQLSDAASRFDMIASKVTQNADESSAAITLANDKAIANLDNLLEAGQRCTSENEKAIQILDKKTSKLLGTTKESRDAIARAGDSFVIRAREFEEHIKASLTTTKDYVIELKTQANAVAEASDEGADQIRFSITDIKGQMDHITKSAKDVSKKISDCGASLEEEGDKLNMRARSATSVSEAAASELARQSNNLAKSVRDSETALERISDMRKQAQQEAFMDSAKFIVESLHSLSVDITRQVKDGEVDDKTWKAFKKGDVSAFTRSLVNIDLDKNTDKLQDKFEKDNAFRSYTLRFIRQFEEILEHAYATSHADILCAAFLSSDLGKLYQSLCVISGRQTKKNIH
jgi:predicted  nucleic acid-binding Zn-ribbon protein